jgi:hypothetical protein
MENLLSYLLRKSYSLDPNQFIEFHFHFEIFGYKFGAEFSSGIIEVSEVKTIKM